jgi:hypothetical protein
MKKGLQITAVWILLAMVVHAEYVTLGGKRVWAGYATAKATIRAVDSDGLPVADANVDARLFNSKYKDMEIDFSGKTDSNGCFVVEGKTTLYLAWTITKPGFYPAHDRYAISETARKLTNEVVDGKWQPWNPTLTTVVKQIRNPIPMYAKYIKVQVPVLGSAIGFDLLECDWVSPYGRGRENDFIVNVTGYCHGATDREVNAHVAFTNAGDGLILHRIQVDENGNKVGCDYRWPYEAPVTGYVDQYDYKVKMRPSSEGRILPERSDEKNYIFRIRTRIEPETGKILSAMYGKVMKSLRFDFYDNEHVEMYMTYYLNPTSNDRNLEFDPKKNLFTNLGEFEQVYEP